MKILVAYDKNTSFANVIDVAVKRAKLGNAFIYLVRTCSEDSSAQEIAELENRLKEILTDEFNEKGIQGEAHILIRGMTPGEDVVAYAQEKQVDEIIIGIKKRSRVGKLMFGSTAQYIILESHCPVLSVK